VQARGEPPPAPTPPSSPRDRAKLLAIVIDGLVMLLLVAAGALLGELLAGKSTREVWEAAGSSVKFPSLELLLWLAPPVLLLLVYTLFISRGQSLGARLRRSD
jgi:hypothetical protein